MADIDLIPTDYRFQIWLRRSALRFGLVLGTLSLVAAAGYFGLVFATGRVRADVEALQARQAVTTQQRDELTRLEDTKRSYERQLALLQGLRSGAAAQAMFETVDRALVDGVWFLDWEFRRAGSVVDEKPRTVATGYFIVVPAGEGRAAEETWKIDTHMAIRGQAQDYSALSNFVRGLLDQPEIQSVRVLESTLLPRATSAVVQFRLAVVVNSGMSSG
jgi:hypothetical protein